MMEYVIGKMKKAHWAQISDINETGTKTKTTTS
jgi:hypothetical protein